MSKAQQIRKELLEAYRNETAKGLSPIDARANAVVNCHTHGHYAAGRDTLTLAHQLDAAIEARAATITNVK